MSSLDWRVSLWDTEVQKREGTEVRPPRLAAAEMEVENGSPVPESSSGYGRRKCDLVSMLTVGIQEGLVRAVGV